MEEKKIRIVVIIRILYTEILTALRRASYGTKIRLIVIPPMNARETPKLHFATGDSSSRLKISRSWIERVNRVKFRTPLNPCKPTSQADQSS